MPRLFQHGPQKIFSIFVCDMQEKVKLAGISNYKQIISNINLLTGAHENKILGSKKSSGGIYAAILKPEKIGDLDPDLKLPSYAHTFKKDTYTMFNPKVYADLKQNGTTDIIITGVETNWCIKQTVESLKNYEYDLHLPIDALGCQNALDGSIALHEIEQNYKYIRLTTTNNIIVDNLLHFDQPESKWYIKNKNKNNVNE
jgi:nicotinamidase-related amidase